MCALLLSRSSTARSGKTAVFPSRAKSCTSPTVSGTAQPVRWAWTTISPSWSAFATPLLSISGVNGLGIWSTTFENSVYWANARLRIAELMTTGIRAVTSDWSRRRQTSSPVVPRSWWSSRIRFGPIVPASSIP